MNKLLTKLFTQLEEEIMSLPPSGSRKAACNSLLETKLLVEKADADERYNPPGKVVMRDEDGKVIGLQG